MESHKKMSIRVVGNGSLVLPQLEEKGVCFSLANQNLRTEFLFMTKFRGK